MENGSKVLIYGAYGYTGKLIVEQAVQRGMRPVVAGRNADKVKELAEKYNLPYQYFEYNNQQMWDEALTDVDLLINCAGPFSVTIKDILSACIRNKTHYTDINGVIDVFSFIREHDEEAKKAGIILLPGVGFDVVPTDCLARYLYEKLPTATDLELAFESNSGFSRGTALTLLKRFDQGGAYRKNGEIVQYPTASIHKIIRFGGEDRHSVGIAWGDVFTAYHTTGISNIRVFTGMPEKMIRNLRRAGKWSGLIKTGLVQRLGGYFIRKNVSGPTEEMRKNNRSYIWGWVKDDAGHEITAELETPESYRLTAETAVLCAERILAGDATPGYNTPATAFGADFILEFEGVTRKLVKE